MRTRCRKCNQMFFSNGMLGNNVCPSCKEAENEQIEKVKEMVKMNPGISIGDVSMELQIPYAKIREYMKAISDSEE